MFNSSPNELRREAIETTHRVFHDLPTDERERLLPLANVMFAELLLQDSTCEVYSVHTVRSLMEGSMDALQRWLDCTLGIKNPC